MNIIHKKENNFGYGNIIASIPAAKRTIFYGSRRNRYFLSFPSMFFQAVFGGFDGSTDKTLIDLSIGFAPEFNGDQTKLYLPPLPNMGLEGEVCLGHVHFFEPSPEKLIKVAMDYFWSSKFEMSNLNEAQNRYNRSVVCMQDFDNRSEMFYSINKWAEYTKLHPDWIPRPDQLHRLDYPSDLILADWKK